MTICKEIYRSDSGYFASINVDKYSNVYTMITGHWTRLKAYQSMNWKNY